MQGSKSLDLFPFFYKGWAGEMVFYMLLMNLGAFFLMGLDKRRACRRQWRISEKTLLSVAFLGGGAGIWLGMQSFRHKTQKHIFKWLMPLALAENVFMFFVYCVLNRVSCINGLF